MKLSRTLLLGLAAAALVAAPATAQIGGGEGKKSGGDVVKGDDVKKTDRQKIIEKYDEDGDGKLTGQEKRKAQPELDKLRDGKKRGDGEKKRGGDGDGEGRKKRGDGEKKRGDGEGRKKRGDGDGPKPGPRPKPGDGPKPKPGPKPTPTPGPGPKVGDA